MCHTVQHYLAKVLLEADDATEYSVQVYCSSIAPIFASLDKCS
jgi:hypothetical protein